MDACPSCLREARPPFPQAPLGPRMTTGPRPSSTLWNRGCCCAISQRGTLRLRGVTWLAQVTQRVSGRAGIRTQPAQLESSHGSLSPPRGGRSALPNPAEPLPKAPKLSLTSLPSCEASSWLWSGQEARLPLSGPYTSVDGAEAHRIPAPPLALLSHISPTEPAVFSQVLLTCHCFPNCPALPFLEPRGRAELYKKEKKKSCSETYITSKFTILSSN